jgi:hypothetical protein
MASAILDRLLQHSHVLTIRGDSYRIREKRRSGLIRPQAGGASSSAIGGVPPPITAKEVEGGEPDASRQPGANKNRTQQTWTRKEPSSGSRQGAAKPLTADADHRPAKPVVACGDGADESRNQ